MKYLASKPEPHDRPPIKGVIIHAPTLFRPHAFRQKARTIEILEAQVALLKEQLAWLQKQVFGAKSERIVADLGQQSIPFAEAEPTAPEPEAVEEIHYQRRKPAKNRGRDTISYPDNLPVKRIELDVPAERKAGSYNPGVNVSGKSPNNGRDDLPTEGMAGRRPTKGNAEQPATTRTRSRKVVSTGLQRVRE